MQILGNKLIADDGMMLTNGESTYCKKVYLAIGTTPDDWREVTEQEAEKAMEDVDPEEALEQLREVLA